MLYVFYGNDVIGVREKAQVFLSTQNVGGVETESVTTENYDRGILRDCAQSVSLFAGVQVVLIDTLSEDSDAFTSLLEDVPVLAQSANIFVVIEGTLLAAPKKAFAEYATDMVEVKRAAGEAFNGFALADALLRRDKKSLWILLVDARRNGLSSEEIIGTLFWQLKILRLAERTKSPEEAGQKPFVYNKAKRALSLFKKGELDTLSRDMLALYHDGHMGKRDIEIALEQWVLKL